MNNKEEVIEKINITIKELNDLIEIQRNDSYLIGYEFGLRMAKNFIEMYEDKGIEKILEILNFQIEGVKVIKEQYESNKST